MGRTTRDRAFVLRTYNLGEADRILVLFGEKTGQFRAVAKGVRRTTSRFGARLQPFNLVDIHFYQGRSELYTVTGAETISAYSSAIAGDYDAFTNAKLIVEGLQRATEGHDVPGSEQFTLLHGALHALASASRPAPLVATSYLLRMASLEGWQPSLETCAHCGARGWHDHFSLSHGGSLCDDCASSDAVQISPATLRLLSALLAADWPTALALPSGDWVEAVDTAGAWVQWQIEQRLRSLPFASITRK